VSLTVSVTEVRNGLRCPRLFVLGRRTGRDQGFPVGASLLGATFHRVVDALARRVDAVLDALDGAPGRPTGGARGGEVDGGGADAAVARAVSEVALSLLVAEIERRPWLASMPAEIDDLAEALRELGSYVGRAVTASEAPPREVLAGFFAHAELALEAIVAGVRVTGRADAVFARGPSEVDVVEYKLTAEPNAPLDRAQVALYRHLLRDRSGVDAQAVVLRFGPALAETRVSDEEADALVREVIEPLVAAMPRWLDEPSLAPATSRSDLCPTCPLRDACSAEYPVDLPPRDHAPATACRPDAETGRAPDAHDATSAAAERGERRSVAPVVASDPGGDAERARCEAAVTKALRDLGVAASITEAYVGPRLVLLEIAARGRVRDLDGAKDALVHHLQTRVGIHARLERDGGLRRIVAERRAPRDVSLDALLAKERAWMAATPGRYVLGETMRGGVLRGDLGDPNACHLLVAGQSGSGKSVLLLALAASLVRFHPPSAVQLAIVDPKRVTFGPHRAALGPHLARPLCYEADQALGILGDLVDDMERRYELLEAAGVDGLDALPEAERPPRVVLIVDEFADLLQAPASAKELEAHLKRLGAKARAAGIHLVLATQRPDAKTMSMGLRANLPGRIALRVADHHNARIILDQPGAEDLLGRGDLLANLGAGLVRAQAPKV
jgi:S-DNA-T family DNA segregation ATPase FtsK/SpoIIIE